MSTGLTIRNCLGRPISIKLKNLRGTLLVLLRASPTSIYEDGSDAQIVEAPESQNLDVDPIPDLKDLLDGNQDGGQPRLSCLCLNHGLKPGCRFRWVYEPLGGMRSQGAGRFVLIFEELLN